jgi:hypothetical protein
VVNGIDMIVDDNGRTWQTGSPALLQSLHITQRDFDLTRYLIRNLGFVRFRTSRSNARITLRPRFLTKPAYERLVHTMVSEECARTVIEIADEPDRIEIIPNVEDAVARLGDLAAPGGQVVRKDFYNEPLSLDRLKGDQRLSPLAHAMRRWRSTRGDVSGDLATTFGNPALRGRVVVIRMVKPDHGILEYAGDGFACFNPDPAWRNSVLGHEMCELPDPQYGQRVAAAYCETHVNHTPRLELVDAVIRVPGSAPRRSRYERLLLPWRRGGSEFVSAVSVLRTSFATEAST